MIRRGRPRKPRLSRMDAAVDAMAPLGFTEKQVKEAVKGLLEVYDGNDAWPVIEEASYTLLLEVMLNEFGNNSKDNSLEEGTSNIASNSLLTDIRHHEECEEDAPNPSDIDVAELIPPVVIHASSEIITFEVDGEVLPADTMENSSCETAREAETGLQLSVKSPLFPSPPATKTHTTRRCWPCYGWIAIDEDEEPNDFMYFNRA